MLTGPELKVLGVLSTGSRYEAGEVAGLTGMGLAAVKRTLTQLVADRRVRSYFTSGEPMAYQIDPSFAAR